MSIKTIDNQAISNNEGVEKRIHKGAEKLVFDILQSTQYSNPIPSTIRELATNACDSQREKEIAIEVLSGKKAPEEYYITRGGDQYKDSNFDSSYYDLEHLNMYSTDIHITYHKNEGVGYCDEVTVKDFGVGLRADRLEGILQLGFSTKRNTSENFGAFGLGAKVALSTGVDFYSIETVHNGKRFKCDCYPYNTKFKYPAFNPHVTFSDGSKVHYEETTERNYTIVSFKVKKHNRNRYVQAVEEQLTYFPNIKFFVKEEDGTREQQFFQSSILYNSDTLIIPSSSVHSLPHIVIVKTPQSSTGINYGAIDFRELEMEDLWGAVGLKCPARQVIKDEFGAEVVIQEGVDVTPSREKVIWNETTKTFVQGLLAVAVSEAAGLIEKSLDETDLLVWVGKCRAILSKSLYSYSSNSDEVVLSRISKMVDTAAIQPKFGPDPTITYKSPLELFKGFGVFSVKETTENGKTSFARKELKSWDEVSETSKFYFQEHGSRQPVTDYCILKTEKFSDALSEIESYIYLAPKSIVSETHIVGKKISEAYSQVLPYLKASNLFIDYSTIEVSERVRDEFDEYIKTEESAGRSASTPKERREENKSVMVRAFSFEPHQWGHHHESWAKVEPTLYTLANPSSPLYYGTLEDKHELTFAVTILRNRMVTNPHKTFLKSKIPPNSSFMPAYGTSYVDEVPQSHQRGPLTRLSIDKTYDTRYNEEALPQVIRVSDTLAKKLAKMPQCYHISSFFVKTTESGEYTTSKEAKMWWNVRGKATSPVWAETLYRIVDIKYTTFFDTIQQYKRYYYGPGEGSHSKDNYQDTVEYYIEYFKNLEEFERYVEDIKVLSNSKELIADKSAKLFILGDIPGAKIIDTEVQEFFKTRDELISDVDVFLSKGSWDSYPTDLIKFRKELTLYLQIHGKLDIELPQLIETQQ